MSKKNKLEYRITIRLGQELAEGARKLVCTEDNPTEYANLSEVVRHAVVEYVDRNIDRILKTK